MDVTMPQLGETVTEGTITRWLKQVGEHVDADEPLFEVSTDKVDSEVPAPVAGVISEILVPEGETVDVGTRLAVLGDAAAAPAPASRPRHPRRRRPSPRLRPRPRLRPHRHRPPPPPGTRRARASARAGARTDAGGGVHPRTAARAHAGRGDGSDAPDVPEAPDRAAGDGRRRSRRRSCAASSPSVASTSSTIPGTGPGGRITRKDVLDAAPTQRPSATPVPRPRSRRSRAHADPGARAGTDARARPGPAPSAVPAPEPAPAPAPAPAPIPASPVAPTADATRPSRSTTSAVAPPSTWCGRRPRARTCTRRSRSTSSGVERVRAAHQAEWKASEGFSLTYLPFIARAFCDTVRRLPAGERERRRRHVGRPPRRQPLDRGRSRLRRSRRAGDPRRRRQAPAADRARGPRPRRPRPHEAAHARRRARGNVHDHEPRAVRHVHDAWPIINQPQVAILSTDGIKKRPVVIDRTRRRRHDRDPPHRDARAHVGPPRVRRRVRRRVPAGHARRSSSSATGKPSSTDAPAHDGSVGFRTAKPTSCSGRCTRAPPTTTCCCSSTRTCTRSARPPIPRTCSCRPATVGADLVRADRGGDVTYHGPGQLVGYPIVTLPEWRDGLRDVVAYVRLLEDVLDRRARRLRDRRPPRAAATPASGSATRRSPPSG